ncbi:MAG: ATP-dependent DNA helicase RecG [Spirochaetales bacterium]|nr:ATP-dependent DNA helicase RecG [Spirochaetales bacterium]
MKIGDIKNPVSSISGVGPQLTKTLAKLNIFTAGDLLQFYPYDYDDRTQKITLNKYNQVKKVHTVAKIIAHEWFGYGTMKTLKIKIEDETASADLICFNRSFLERTLPPGTIVTVTGQFFVKYNTLQSTAFEVEKMELPATEFQDDFPLKDIQPLNSKIFPVYHLTEGLTQKALCKTISKALQQYALGIENELPEEIIKQRNLLSKQKAIRAIHEPDSIQEAVNARNTLIYEELFLFQQVILSRAEKRKGTIQNQNEKNEKTFISEEEFLKELSPMQETFLNKLPFALTDDQRKVIYEMNEEIDRSYTERSRILNQLDRGLPPPVRPAFSMARLLQGDVGSGKTLVSLFICLRILNWKGQCALMAPTEILARQHAENAARLLEPLGIRTAFLTGNVKAAGRNQLLKRLKDGEIDIVIGTHALFSSQVIFKDLQLVIIDEQHRFGVQQRQAIIEKGRRTEKGFTFEANLLMMSATPIPQSLALTIFGDLDISTIHTKPNGRKPVTTYLVKEGNEINAYEAVRKELEKGHQAYFVYPAIDSDENIKSAERAFEKLSKHIYPQYKSALLHSKVEEEEQVRILRSFREGQIQVLAATTVIEVGVDVPNATCMVIEQADRFGMAQLHQLRGRVGRGAAQSFCFLIYSKDITETGIERMKALRQSTDGFYIAEQDLKTRGPGELNGTLQAGALEFRIADLSRDEKILNFTREDIIKLHTLQDGVLL